MCSFHQTETSLRTNASGVSVNWFWVVGIILQGQAHWEQKMRSHKKRVCYSVEVGEWNHLGRENEPKKESERFCPRGNKV